GCFPSYSLSARQVIDCSGFDDSAACDSSRRAWQPPYANGTPPEARAARARGGSSAGAPLLPVTPRQNRRSSSLPRWAAVRETGAASKQPDPSLASWCTSGSNGIKTTQG
ncbi:MAG: hypothetical protein QGF59_23695, partial [Pirellulaceae bacterium]|nr:hypothetical protein [Pirellulaceae bacterium]